MSDIKAMIATVKEVPVFAGQCRLLTHLRNAAARETVASRVDTPNSRRWNMHLVYGHLCKALLWAQADKAGASIESDVRALAERAYFASLKKPGHGTWVT